MSVNENTKIKVKYVFDALYEDVVNGHIDYQDFIIMLETHGIKVESKLSTLLKSLNEEEYKLLKSKMKLKSFKMWWHGGVLRLP